MNENKGIEGLSQCSGELVVQTPGKALCDITAQVSGWLSGHDAQEGMLTVFVRHTSASLTIQENADPDVQRDLGDALARLAPENHPYRHGSEGPDDMPAHIRSALTDVSLSIPVMGGRMRLGTWQGLYIWEHRARPHRRRIALHFMGTLS